VIKVKLGFLTNALVWEGLNDIEKMAQWAAENGFQALEVGPALPLNEDAFRRVAEDGKVKITALTYCRNFLSANQEDAERHQAELLRRIETAGRLGIPTVVTSTGINDYATEDMAMKPFDVCRSRAWTMLPSFLTKCCSWRKRQMSGSPWKTVR
jgi:sugar phosphate isomerase/epimerase